MITCSHIITGLNVETQHDSFVMASSQSKEAKGIPMVSSGQALLVLRILNK